MSVLEYLEENKKFIGQRLKDARRRTHKSAYVIEDLSGIPVEDILCIESGDQTVTSEQLFKLAQLYEIQTYKILRGELPYHTSDEWLEAFHNEHITESVLADGLHVDIVEARKLYLDYFVQKGR